MTEPQNTAMPKPGIGRIVHYVSHGTPVQQDGSQAFPKACRAAVITAIGRKRKGVASLSICVMNPTGLFFHEGVPYDEASGPGTWHWPERV